jgi:CRP/FNR family transcriptional regulator/CRP/FNR family cyclic AMP-dependent transcriptional regulator
MRAFNVSADEVLCTEGEPGGSAMVVVRGTIAVTIRVRGRDQPLSMLEAGAMFGQLSLVQREPRSATCATTTDALLLEIDDDACNRLLAQRSGTALKFLGALTYDVIAALRAADRRLVRLRRADAEGLKEELLRAANVDVRTHLEPYNRASSYP